MSLALLVPPADQVLHRAGADWHYPGGGPGGGVLLQQSRGRPRVRGGRADGAATLESRSRCTHVLIVSGGGRRGGLRRQPTGVCVPLTPPPGSNGGRFSTGNPWNEESAPALAGGTVSLGSSGNSPYAVNGHSRQQRWTSLTGHYVTAIRCVHERPGLLRKLGQSPVCDGCRHWKGALGIPYHWSVASCASVVDGLVYVGSWDLSLAPAPSRGPSAGQGVPHMRAPSTRPGLPDLPGKAHPRISCWGVRPCGER